MNKYKSGLKRIRNFGLSRRNFNKGALGAAALTGLATVGIPGIANAATDVTFLGWEGYDSGLFVDSYLNYYLINHDKADSIVSPEILFPDIQIPSLKLNHHHQAQD